jgi:hypothetical protein
MCHYKLNDMNILTYAQFALLLFVTVSCTAQNPPGARIEIPGGTTKDFGTVSHTDRLDHNFILRNAGRDTVVVTDVKAACGCTGVMVSGRTMPPGGVAEVAVRFVPPRTSNGTVSKSVSVYIEGAEHAVYVLRVSADVKSAFESDPPLVDVGSIAVNAKTTASFDLINASAEPKSVVAAQSALAIEYHGLDGNSPPEVRHLEGVSIEPMEFELEPGGRKTVTVHFTPPFAGKVMGAIVLYSENETRQVEFTGAAQRAR